MALAQRAHVQCWVNTWSRFVQCLSIIVACALATCSMKISGLKWPIVFDPEAKFEEHRQKRSSHGRILSTATRLPILTLFHIPSETSSETTSSIIPKSTTWRTNVLSRIGNLFSCQFAGRPNFACPKLCRSFRLNLGSFGQKLPGHMKLPTEHL